ncbi:MAG: CAP domain-containing protein [Richelia sp. RM2_1_2]|nr:CAP domain-containing protein [Richelia sp. SM1_7_0]NJN08492.1 CAP domain-containing protein [Richelia sp. RM1_1_1]NJO29318.1 CAP domain-containing protein [Richelia sp. SL_2_1]NJO61552.1 CAP domain-containing protein [Richelia sp. RM2_1_2]
MSGKTLLGIAFTTLVLGSAMTTKPVPGHTSTSEPTVNKPLSIPSRPIKLSTNIKTTDLEIAIFDQINQYRVSKKLPKLKLDEKISKQARIHSQNMAKHQVPFSHNGFAKRVDSISISYNNAAENVAFNSGYDDPVAEAVTGWIKSPGHLKNIHGKYNLTGVGVAANSEGEFFLTQIFILSR